MFFLLQSIEFNNAVILTSVIKLHFFTRPDTNTFLSCWIFNSFKAELIIIVAALTAAYYNLFEINILFSCCLIFGILCGLLLSFGDMLITFLFGFNRYFLGLICLKLHFFPYTQSKSEN